MAGESPILDSLLIFFIGFFIFGPQMLIGMAAAEIAHKKAAVTSNGFVCWCGYIGAAVAGYPLGTIAQNWGWNGFFMTLVFCGVGSTLLLIPLWNAKAPEHQLAEERA